MRFFMLLSYFSLTHDICFKAAFKISSVLISAVIFAAFTGDGAPGIADPDASAVTMVWSYLAETIFNMLVLVGLVKGADRIVKEMMAL